MAFTSRSPRASTLSLKARAIAALARRDHSRVELARKLAPHAESPEALEALLDWLVAGNWLSEQRFVESWVRRRGDRLGTQRVRHELAQHSLSAELTDPVLATLERSEFDRARDVWGRRYDAAPADREEYARQGRFLASRGFRTDVIHRVLKAQPASDDE
ncbi:recombination regulator RecX [soil metagenome]